MIHTEAQLNGVFLFGRSHRPRRQLNAALVECFGFILQDCDVFIGFWMAVFVYFWEGFWEMNEEKKNERSEIKWFRLWISKHFELAAFWNLHKHTHTQKNIA